MRQLRIHRNWRMTEVRKRVVERPADPHDRIRNRPVQVKHEGTLF
jgi:hypothetical protein